MTGRLPDFIARITFTFSRNSNQSGNYRYYRFIWDLHMQIWPSAVTDWNNYLFIFDIKYISIWNIAFKFFQYDYWRIFQNFFNRNQIFDLTHWQWGSKMSFDNRDEPILYFLWLGFRHVESRFSETLSDKVKTCHNDESNSRQ